MSPARVLFSDERVVALDKPPGVSLQTPPRAPQSAVERLVAAVDAVERDAYGLDAATLRLVHRLDVGTSGVVLLARDAEAHALLVRAFSERLVRKVYLALAWGRPRPARGLFDQPLGPDRADRRRMKVDPAGRPARTAYEVLAAPGHVALVRLEPQTGRTHQIRVHLAAAGHPIVGDDLYGGPRHHGVRDVALRALLAPTHTLLHAWRLHVPALPGPARAGIAERIVTAPLPDAFERALRALGVDPGHYE